MAKFCRFCGAPLEEGQVCSCQSTAAPEAVVTEVSSVAVDVAPVASGTLLDTLKTALKGLLKAPKATADAVAEDKNGLAVAGILAGINALAVFFFIWRIFGQIFSLVADMMGKLSGLGSMMGGAADIPDMEMGYPIFPMLVSGILIATLGIALTALIVFVVGKIAKAEVDLKKLLVVESTHSVFHSVLMLVGILLGFISWQLQMFVLLLMLVLWLVNTCAEVHCVTGQSANESTKSLGIQTGILCVALAIAIFVISKLVGWCFGELTVNGTALGDALGMLGSLL